MATVYVCTGRRKCAIARVRLTEGTGRIFVNERELKEYFTVSKHLRAVNEPLVALKGEKSYDITATVIGGGPTGQAGAIRLGIARALARVAPEFEKTMRGGKLLTRDSRVKERKKYGRRGARRGFQFSKR